MNDFFDSLKEIKKELVKEQGDEKKPTKPTQKDSISKEEVVAKKEQQLAQEFLSYIKHSDVRKF
ncbi:hypothetical protein [Campylobacter suis]|uniref:Uncharacterized protein n=1 Tax=Campylobacter suis TaxID=2790657 RepID=A0ABM8Q2J0_9BACT|nr:hypothetical protein [Campylobacter suis]CAD7287068.1 hypothetical protein LMG8286_00699 [Campylobacter suis]